jgi:hypothetical protein
MSHHVSLHEVIYSNDVLTYLHPGESQKLRALLAGKTVGVDVSFMAGFGSCDTIADLGKEIGKVCVGLILAGGIPVLFVEGQFQPLGAGKHAKAAARAAAARRRLPATHLEAYYAPESSWRDRFRLKRTGAAFTFEEVCRAVARFGEQIGLEVVQCARTSAAEGVAAAQTRPLIIGGVEEARRRPPPAPSTPSPSPAARRRGT